MRLGFLFGLFVFSSLMTATNAAAASKMSAAQGCRYLKKEIAQLSPIMTAAQKKSLVSYRTTICKADSKAELIWSANEAKLLKFVSTLKKAGAQQAGSQNRSATTRKRRAINPQVAGALTSLASGFLGGLGNSMGGTAGQILTTVAPVIPQLAFTPQLDFEAPAERSGQGDFVQAGSSGEPVYRRAGSSFNGMTCSQIMATVRTGDVFSAPHQEMNREVQSGSNPRVLVWYGNNCAGSNRASIAKTKTAVKPKQKVFTPDEIFSPEEIAAAKPKKPEAVTPKKTDATDHQAQDEVAKSKKTSAIKSKKKPDVGHPEQPSTNLQTKPKQIDSDHYSDVKQEIARRKKADAESKAKKQQAEESVVAEVKPDDIKKKLQSVAEQQTEIQTNAALRWRPNEIADDNTMNTAGAANSVKPSAQKIPSYRAAYFTTGEAAFRLAPLQRKEAQNWVRSKNSPPIYEPCRKGTKIPTSVNSGGAIVILPNKQGKMVVYTVKHAKNSDIEGLLFGNFGGTYNDGLPEFFEMYCNGQLGGSIVNRSERKNRSPPTIAPPAHSGNHEEENRGRLAFTFCATDG